MEGKSKHDSVNETGNGDADSCKLCSEASGPATSRVARVKPCGVVCTDEAPHVQKPSKGWPDNKARGRVTDANTESFVAPGEKDPELTKRKSQVQVDNGTFSEGKKPRSQPLCIPKPDSSAATFRPANTKRKGNKPSDMPRRALTAYNIFFQEQRQAILREKKRNKKNGLPDSTDGNSQSSMARTISKLWKAVKPDELARLKKLAEADSERYSREMEEYQYNTARKYGQSATPQPSPRKRASHTTEKAAFSAAGIASDLNGTDDTGGSLRKTASTGGSRELDVQQQQQHQTIQSVSPNHAARSQIEASRTAPVPASSLQAVEQIPDNLAHRMSEQARGLSAGWPVPLSHQTIVMNPSNPFVYDTPFIHAAPSFFPALQEPQHPLGIPTTFRIPHFSPTASVFDSLVLPQLQQQQSAVPMALVRGQIQLGHTVPSAVHGLNTMHPDLCMHPRTYQAPGCIPISTSTSTQRGMHGPHFPESQSSQRGQSLPSHQFYGESSESTHKARKERQSFR